ncbi:MAG TPA: FAD-dependent oxidoreductase [Methylocella sp.]|nr:FAD-dependent oxidoreductase [Methylocella sp.]
MRVHIIGAGVAGLTAALAFAERGCEVELTERETGPGLGCSRFAGGMLAPWCEAEASEEIILTLGRESLKFWFETVPGVEIKGTLVVASSRDRPELDRFARRATGYERAGAERIAALEPDLAGRFEEALYFPGEGHLEPRKALDSLARRLAACQNVTIRFGAESLSSRADWTVDCRGLAARGALPDLRGVKGEMLVLATREVSLSRPVRLLHPRFPIYIVPRGDGRFMAGATMIENEEAGRITARSMLELLGAAYALHPAFAEAEVVETGCGVRPAFPDNLPKIRCQGRTLYINGLYRHGFLAAPALARRAVQYALEGAYFPEVMDAYHGKRRSA